MVLDLEIQSTYQPAYQFITGSKISCGLDLVSGKLIIKLIGFNVYHRKLGVFNSMGKLENNAHYKKPNEPVKPSQAKDRYYDKDSCVVYFNGPELNMISRVHFFQRHSADL